MVEQLGQHRLTIDEGFDGGGRHRRRTIAVPDSLPGQDGVERQPLGDQRAVQGFADGAAGKVEGQFAVILQLPHQLQGAVELKDPDGDVIESFELPTTPGITLSNQVKFAMVEGSTAFVVGDGFDITIAAGSGLYKIVNSANIDGSNVAECVLAETTVVASGAESKAVVYTRGVFNEDHLVYSGSDTYATHAERLRMLGILLTEEK